MRGFGTSSARFADLTLGAQRMETEHRTMECIESRLDGSPVQRGILRPSLVFQREAGVWSVSEYVAPAWRMDPIKSSPGRIAGLIDLSCDWLLSFQRATMTRSAP